MTHITLYSILYISILYIDFNDISLETSKASPFEASKGMFRRRGGDLLHVDVPAALPATLLVAPIEQVAVVHGPIGLAAHDDAPQAHAKALKSPRLWAAPLHKGRIPKKNDETCIKYIKIYIKLYKII